MIIILPLVDLEEMFYRGKGVIRKKGSGYHEKAAKKKKKGKSIWTERNRK